MRQLGLSLVLILAAGLAAAFEAEERRMFGDPGGRVLKVISTTDAEVFVPIVEPFLRDNPGVAVDYTVASSAELMRALDEEGAAFDVAISSAMDLQTKLANDGLARRYRSAATAALPGWARWREHVFAFTQEPAAIVLSRAAFEGLDMPRSRQELIAVLREHPERFRGRIGTYDVRVSGLGYLFATQDARASETYWRLMEVMGGLGTRLYCCSSRMIDDVAAGPIAVAYNVLGSYARARTDVAGRIEIVEPGDFTTVMLRTALIPSTARAPELAGRFVDHLLGPGWSRDREAGAPFPRIDPAAMGDGTALRPIRMGPGLLVYLDRFKRAAFLREWESAVLRR